MALVPEVLGFRRKPYHLVRHDKPRPDAAPAAAATPEPALPKAEDLPPVKSARRMVKEYLAEPDRFAAGFRPAPGKPHELRYGPDGTGALLVDSAAEYRAFARSAGKTRDPELCDLHRRMANAYKLWLICRSSACQRAKACSRSAEIACVYEQREALEPHLPALLRGLKARRAAEGWDD